MSKRNWKEPQARFFVLPFFHYSIIPLFLWHVALKVDRRLFIDVRSLIAHHGDAGMPVKIVLAVFPAVVDEKILFLVDQFQDVTPACLKMGS